MDIDLGDVTNVTPASVQQKGILKLRHDKMQFTIFFLFLEEGFFDKER
jgi:hypothetical protein